MPKPRRIDRTPPRRARSVQAAVSREDLLDALEHELAAKRSRVPEPEPEYVSSLGWNHAGPLPFPEACPGPGRKVPPVAPRDACDTRFPIPEFGDSPMANVSTRFLGSANKARAWGYPSLGLFAADVRKLCEADPGPAEQRILEKLRNASLTTYGNEGVGSDGGFAIPPEFRDTILQKVEADSLMGLCDQQYIASAAIEFPKDEGAPWAASGQQAHWTGEAEAMSQSRPAVETSTVKLHKLTCLVPMTDEVLEDAPGLSAWLTRKAADVIDFKVTDAIINGTGAGMPLGILNAGCTVSQAAETSQVADTIHGLNLVKMWARMPAQWRTSGVWLIHPDVEPELMKAGLQVSNPAQTLAVGGALAYQPAGAGGSPNASLFGRPVIPVESCQPLGDVGDIIFASLNQYAIFLRNPGLKAESSIHLWFDQGVTAFRFTLRVGGQPWWSSTIPAKNGSTTYGPFVTLAAR